MFGSQSLCFARYLESFSTRFARLRGPHASDQDRTDWRGTNGDGVGARFRGREAGPAGAVLASDPSDAARAAFGARCLARKSSPRMAECFAACDVVILAVKPQMMKPVLAEVRELMRPMRSWCRSPPGVTIARLAAGLAVGQRIVRVMPNTPCLIGRGASGYSLGPHGHGRRREAGRPVARRRWASLMRCRKRNSTR